MGWGSRTIQQSDTGSSWSYRIAVFVERHFGVRWHTHCPLAMKYFVLTIVNMLLMGCSSLQQQIGMSADELRAVANDKSTAIVCIPGRLLILNRDLTPKDTGSITVDGPSCTTRLEGSNIQGVTR